MSTYKNIGARIKKQRSVLGITQLELARKLELSDDSRTTIAKWEKGKAFPSAEMLSLLCVALKCDIGYLFGEYDEPIRSVSDISAVTGLTPKASKTLVSLSDVPMSENAKRNFLNTLLTYSSFHYISKLFQEYIDLYRECTDPDAYLKYCDSMKYAYPKASKKEFYELQGHHLKESEFKFILELSHFLEAATKFSKN